MLSSASGALAFAGIMERTERLRSDPGFLPEYRELFDFTGVTRSELSCAQIQDIVKRPLFAPSSRRAFLVADDLGFGMGRVSSAYHELNGEKNVMVFRNRGKALRWLETGEKTARQDE